jgi:hypothetical protein
MRVLIALAWILAVTVGLVAGGFVLHFPGSYGESQISVGAGVFGFLLGAVNGLLVGAVAALALRLGRGGATRLMGATALAIGVTHALNDSSSTQLPFALVQLVAGAATAGAFAWRFTERRPSALAVIGVAWALGIVVAGWSGDRIGLPLTETGLGWAQDHGWDGLVTGVIWATATAVIGVPASIRGWRPAPQRSTPTVEP